MKAQFLEPIIFIINHEVYQEGKEVQALFLEPIFFIVKHEVYQEGKEVRAQFLETITIKVPLFKKNAEHNVFFAGLLFLSHFKGLFEGLKKRRGTLKKS